MTLFPELEAERLARAAADKRAAEQADAASRKLEEDLTPRGTVRPLIAEAGLVKVFDVRGDPWVADDHAMLKVGDKIPIEVSADRPLRVLDACCGFGVWASEFARWWVLLGLPREWLHITGIDIDQAKRDHAEKWCDVVGIGRIGEALSLRGSCSFDLAIGNPAFSLLAPKVTPKGRPGPSTIDAAIERSLITALLAVCPVALMFHQVASFQRGRVGQGVWRRHGLALELRVPGSIDFRGKRINPKNSKPWASDLRCYCATVWRRGFECVTETRLIDDLDAADRAWIPFDDDGVARKGPRQPPGTETPDQARAMGLVLAPGNSPRGDGLESP